MRQLMPLAPFIGALAGLIAWSSLNGVASVVATIAILGASIIFVLRMDRRRTVSERSEHLREWLEQDPEPCLVLRGQDVLFVNSALAKRLGYPSTSDFWNGRPLGEHPSGFKEQESPDQHSLQNWRFKTKDNECIELSGREWRVVWDGSAAIIRSFGDDHAHSVNDRDADSAPAPAFNAICASTFPIWCKQLDACISISGDEMQNISLRFNTIVETVEEAIAAINSLYTPTGDIDHEQLQFAQQLINRLHGTIREEVQESLTGMQFQDRVSQILENMKRNIEQLSENLDSEELGVGHENLASKFDIQSLLGDMRARYTTSEERHLHGATTDPDAQENEDEIAKGEVVFF